VLLSILIPVYNERTVVETSLAQVLGAPLPESMERELIVVDDCSSDGTSDILTGLAAAEPRIKLFRHEVNQGKGAAVRTAISKASGDFCIIQDADLEYDPAEYPRLLRPLLDGRADAVFGSRYLVREQARVLPFWHTMMNRTLTFICNMFCNLTVTDMETCYKVFRTDLLKSIPIRSDRFGIEPELTMKAAKRRLRIYEVPISYHGRTYEEGKKISWRDGVKALGVILKFWVIDDLYTEPYGKGALINFTRTPAYISWVSGLLRPELGDEILELGAGIGTFTGAFLGRRRRYVAAEYDPLYLHSLRNRFLRTPNVSVADIDPGDASAYGRIQGPFDTTLCLNVLEGARDPATVLAGICSVLGPGGVLCVLVPQHSALFGTVDQALGQRRRFDLDTLQKLLDQAGFRVEKTWQLNKAGVFGWWWHSRVAGSRRIPKLSLKIFDKTIWLWRLVDKILPWGGLSLLLVARRKG
jgi:glycosyltransferase involved in cell wall biosynthesis